MQVELITFAAMRDIWQTYVWPDDGTAVATDPQQYRSGIDDTIVSKYIPTFFGIKRDNIIIGAIGGHRTTSNLYRVRGLFLDPKLGEKQRVIANALISACASQAKKEGCRYLWDTVHEDDMMDQMGFVETDVFSDDRFYALFTIR